MQYNKKIKIIDNFFWKDERQELSKILLEKHFFNVKELTITKSKKNSIRGLHFQINNPQEKIIYVINGEICDYSLNIDPKSKQYGFLTKIKLKASDNKAIFIPANYAHGYLTMKENTSVLMLYSEKTNNKDAMVYNILEYISNRKDLIISEKDLNAVSFKSKNV